MKTTASSLSHLLMSHKNKFSIFSLLLMVLLGLGLPGLGFDSSYRVFFDEDNTNLQDLDRLNAQFNSPDNVGFLVEAKSGDLINEENIQSIEKLVKSSWTLPYSTRVESFINAPYSKPEGNNFYVEDLIPESRPLDQNGINRIKEMLGRDKYVEGRLISPDHKFAIILVSLVFPDGEKQDIDGIVSAADEIRNELLSETNGVEIKLFGGAFIDYSTMEASIIDAENLMPLMLGVATLLGYIVLRSIALVIASQIIIFASILSGLGIAGWLGYELNSVSFMAALLILILALADSVHIGSTFLKERQKGLDKYDAVLSSLEKNILAVFLTSLTTAMGFASLNLIDSHAFADLGNVSIFGVAMAFVYSITLFPFLLVLFSKDSVNKGVEHTAVSKWIADTAIEQRKWISLFFFALVLITGPFILQNTFNNDYLEFYDENTELRQAVKMLDRNMPNIRTIDYGFETHQENGINNPEFLAKVDQFSSWYEKQDGVANVYSYLDVIKKLNRDMHAGDPDWYKIPEDSALASQYLLLYEMSLSMGQSLEELMDMDRSALKVTIALEHVDDVQVLALEKKANAWLQQNMPDGEVSVASPDLMFAHLSSTIVSSMMNGSFFTVIFVTLTLMLGLKSFRYGLISLIPNLIPAFVVYGVWGLLVKEMNQAVAVTYSVSLGLIVDDTVHILSKYISQRRLGVNAEAAIRYTLENTAVALIVTTLMVGTGLFIMTFATFAPNAQIGMIMAPIIVIALLFDLFFLPSLLLFLDRERGTQTSRAREIDEPSLQEVA